MPQDNSHALPTSTPAPLPPPPLVTGSYKIYFRGFRKFTFLGIQALHGLFMLFPVTNIAANPGQTACSNLTISFENETHTLNSRLTLSNLHNLTLTTMDATSVVLVNLNQY